MVMAVSNFALAFRSLSTTVSRPSILSTSLEAFSPSPLPLLDVGSVLPLLLTCIIGVLALDTNFLVFVILFIVRALMMFCVSEQSRWNLRPRVLEARATVMHRHNAGYSLSGRVNLSSTRHVQCVSADPIANPVVKKAKVLKNFDAGDVRAFLWLVASVVGDDRGAGVDNADDESGALRLFVCPPGCVCASVIFSLNEDVGTTAKDKKLLLSSKCFSTNV